MKIKFSFRTKISKHILTLYALSSLILFLTCKKDQLYEDISEINVFNNTAKPTDMSFVNRLEGFVSASYEIDDGAAVIAKTIDGGSTWKKIPVYVDAIPTTIIRNIFAKSIDSVYATYNLKDDRRGVCFSKDGGLTWANLGNIIAGGGYSGIYFKTGQIGFVCSSGDIFQTKDGGNNWETVFDYDGFGGIGKLFFTSEKTGYAYGGFVNDHGSFGSIVKTNDGGNTWTELTSMLEFVTCLAFTDDNTGYAFTFENNIYKTTNGGTNWVLMKNITGTGSSYYSAIVSGKIKYIASGPSIFKTTDDFRTITEIYKSPLYLAELSVNAVRPSENTLFFLSSQQAVINIVQNYK
jgi:photosystem II stability/assembly factor-like uncharacterized protein